MEMGRPSEAIDDMSQGVPLHIMPRRNIPPPPLELDDHITDSRQKLLREMVPHTPSRPAVPAPTYIIQSQPTSQALPEKKKDPRKGGNHITVSRQKLLREMVPRTPSRPAVPAPTYIIQSQPTSQAVPEKKKDPTERWDLQSP